MHLTTEMWTFSITKINDESFNITSFLERFKEVHLLNNFLVKFF